MALRAAIGDEATLDRNRRRDPRRQADASQVRFFSSRRSAAQIRHLPSRRQLAASAGVWAPSGRGAISAAAIRDADDHAAARSASGPRQDAAAQPRLALESGADTRRAVVPFVCGE